MSNKGKSINWKALAAVLVPAVVISSFLTSRCLSSAEQTDASAQSAQIDELYINPSRGGAREDLFGLSDKKSDVLKKEATELLDKGDVQHGAAKLLEASRLELLHGNETGFADVDRALKLAEALPAKEKDLVLVTLIRLCRTTREFIFGDNRWNVAEKLGRKALAFKNRLDPTIDARTVFLLEYIGETLNEQHRYAEELRIESEAVEDARKVYPRYSEVWYDLFRNYVRAICEGSKDASKAKQVVSHEITRVKEKGTNDAELIILYEFARTVDREAISNAWNLQGQGHTDEEWEASHKKYEEVVGQWKQACDQDTKTICDLASHYHSSPGEDGILRESLNVSWFIDSTDAPLEYEAALARLTTEMKQPDSGAIERCCERMIKEGKIAEASDLMKSALSAAAGSNDKYSFKRFTEIADAYPKDCTVAEPKAQSVLHPQTEEDAVQEELNAACESGDPKRVFLAKLKFVQYLREDYGNHASGDGEGAAEKKAEIAPHWDAAADDLIKAYEKISEVPSEDWQGHSTNAQQWFPESFENNITRSRPDTPEKKDFQRYQNFCLAVVKKVNDGKDGDMFDHMIWGTEERFEQEGWNEQARLILSNCAGALTGAKAQPHKNRLLTRLANIDERVGKFSEALAIRKEVLAQYMRSGNPSEKANALLSVAATSLKMGDNIQCLKSWKQAVTLAKASPARYEDDSVAEHMGKLAVACAENGQPRQAVDVYVSAIDLARLEKTAFCMKNVQERDNTLKEMLGGGGHFDQLERLLKFEAAVFKDFYGNRDLDHYGATLYSLANTYSEHISAEPNKQKREILVPLEKNAYLQAIALYKQVGGPKSKHALDLEKEMLDRLPKAPASKHLNRSHG